MSQPDTDMVDTLVDLVDSEWDSNAVDRGNLLVADADDLGKGRDLGTYDYIEVSATSPLGIEYADLFWHSQDVDTVTFVEIKASTKSRREDLFGEFRRIVEAHRKRPDTPGDHDRMRMQDITKLDDDTFGAYVVELTVAFESRSRGVQT